MHYAQLLIDWPQTQWDQSYGVTLGSVHQAEVHNPTVLEGDCHLEQEVWDDLVYILRT